MLNIRDLHVNYGNIVALRGVSLDVGEGEIVAVIGPNGAGKSTLLLAVAGVVKARAGSIELAGRNTAQMQAEALVSAGLSLVPEGRHIFGSLSVAENLALGATVRRDRKQIAADIDKVLAMFPVLKDRYRQRANKLSGGEQQMLAIGRAMLARPKLLLLDEPSLGLAPLVVNQVYQAVLELRRSGVTVLIVEQNVTRALAAADRTYVLSSGAIAMSGKSADLSGTAAFDAAYFGVAGEGGKP
ncbi:ABC transporter ATP-binding protein [Mesorhizobium sp. NZP2298]|uniref:ABC transporter ATP-binding protein n=1 Tax=Mesorhizobium sp. NZP2298 TaxID=2483403 RepID=UPI0015574DCB|nr:ABC transporter ATP-binding protein [Mesorhizobium sp. NZP2298]QKC95618.1 ABC transporter ATP-binding protein [Mesorhizobium sp. NZP2298]